MKKITNLDNKYENFRWFFTSNDLLVVGGKNDEQNESVIENFLKPEYVVIHTTAPGSPFMIIQSEKSSKKDIEETAIFTACFSKQWKLKTKKVSIDIFKGKQIYKTNNMKKGTFGINGSKKTINVVPELVLVFQKGRLRSVPNTTKEEKLVEIKQGNLSKEEAAQKISKIIKEKYHYPITKEEIMAAIPSDKLSVK